MLLTLITLISVVITGLNGSSRLLTENRRQMIAFSGGASEPLNIMDLIKLELVPISSAVNNNMVTQNEVNKLFEVCLGDDTESSATIYVKLDVRKPDGTILNTGYVGLNDGWQFDNIHNNRFPCVIFDKYNVFGEELAGYQWMGLYFHAGGPLESLDDDLNIKFIRYYDSFYSTEKFRKININKEIFTDLEFSNSGFFRPSTDNPLTTTPITFTNNIRIQFELWINAFPLSSWQTILECDNNMPLLTLSSGNKLNVDWNVPSGDQTSEDVEPSTGPFELNQYYFIQIIKTGDNLTIKINGEEVLNKPWPMHKTGDDIVCYGGPYNGYAPANVWIRNLAIKNEYSHELFHVNLINGQISPIDVFN